MPFFEEKKSCNFHQIGMLIFSSMILAGPLMTALLSAELVSKSIHMGKIRIEGDAILKK